MTLIKTSYSKLSDALKSNQSVTINAKGEWHVDGWFIRFVRWLFDLKQGHLKKISGVFSSLLDQIERETLFFNADSITHAKQLRRISGHLKVAKSLTKAMEQNITSPSCKEVALLKRKIIALRYRIETSNGGKDRLEPNEIDLEVRDQLLEMAEQWKGNQKFFSNNNHQLHPLDLKKIEEVCRYPLFVNLLMSDERLKHDFFGWTLKNCNGVQAFVEYPSICKKIKSIFLAGRIGRFAYENVLSIKKTNIFANEPNSSTQKVIRLPFEGKKISILNENAYVCLRRNHCVTIKTIFHDMSLRNKQPGKFEFMGSKGLCNWRSDMMAYWNPETQKWTMTNLESPHWWRRLPPFEKISRETLMKRYNLDEISSDRWVLAVLAARQSIDYNIENCHGYSEVLIPDGKGFWSVYPFGKFAKEWPNDCFDYLSVIANTTKADYIYPDPNIFYSAFRQQAAVPFVVTKEEGLRYMNDHVRKNIRKGREGNLVFMLGYENCAFSPQNDAETVLGKKCEGGRVPNLFLSPFFDSGLSGPLLSYYKLLKHAPRFISAPLQRLTEMVLGSWRSIKVLDDEGKIVRKSLSSSPFRKGIRLECDGRMKTVYNHIFHPSHLHRQIIQNTISDGVIWSGQHHFQ